MPLAIAIPANLGYLALFAFVAVESAGFPVPGETALIAGGVLASKGKLSLELVVVIAAAAAIIGDNVGYAIGRAGGRRLLERPGPFEEHRRRIIEQGTPFFERHGPKAVFLGRWITVLRIAAAWLAGISRMPWRTFLVWNALGGIAWATSIGVLAYLVGPAAEKILKISGLGGIGVVLAVGVGVLLWRRRAGVR